MSIEVLVDNPGEPHLSDEVLTAEARVRRDGVVGNFKRRFVSDKPAQVRMSQMIIVPGDLIRSHVCVAFHLTTHLNVFGFDADNYALALEGFPKLVKIELLGEEIAFGLNAKRVRF